MTSAVPVNGFTNPTSNQSNLAEQTTGGGVVSSDKNKEWQMELLMEKLRSKASTFKPLIETAKNVRMTMLDKRFGIDSVEKNQLQKCLDALQHSIKVKSLQSMIERLESLSRQLGLKFVTSGTSNSNYTELFITSDMFYLEVLLEPSGAVKDVKINHEGKPEQQSCEELVSCLSRGDFVDFTTQLEGLASIYQLNADKKVKCKAFSALQSLETDLGTLAQIQSFLIEPFNLVHKSPVGILEKRKGGHAMKLTYFVSSYDLIDVENKSCEALSTEAVVSKKVGHSVTVCMEGSTAHKLPTSSIITAVKSPSGKCTPSYAALTSANSSMLPACFVLKLAKKMPICLELIRRIQKLTELECTDVSAPYPLISMIVQHASDKQLDCKNNRGLTVSLPDQQHCYFMTENKSMEGVLVGSIPFTHPTHVPLILVCLRQQALFNTLISSCVRPMAKQDADHTTIFEVSALSWQCISISLEHPFEETLATAELDLSDISALKCKLYGVNVPNIDQTSDVVGKVLQRCLSIPLTMRTLIKIWEGRTLMLNSSNGRSNGNFNNNLGTGNREHNNHNGSNVPEFNSEDIKIKQEPGSMNGTGTTGRQQQSNQQQQSFLEAGTENSIGFPSFSGSSDTPPSSMLNPLQIGALSNTSPPDSKSKKSRKRKAADGSWKSPKRKSDLDSSEILLESSSSDSTPLGTPTGGRDIANDNRTPTPTSISAASIASGGIDLSNLDSLEVLSTDKSSDYDVENDTEIMQVEPLVTSIEDAIKRERKFKKRVEEKSAHTNIFEDNKTLVSPSVSITPISSGGSSQNTNYNSMLTSMGLERRPGIEIIPITSLSQTPLPSSITITAISNPTSKSSSIGDDRKERKSSKNRLSSSAEDSQSKLEKKRKRKRDSSPMGPPEKLPPKQDPLSKPVSVCIKATSDSPSGSLASSSSRPSSPATTLRKFSPSPTQIGSSSLVMVNKSSPTGLKQSSSGGNNKPAQSPKHSPVYSSPKQMITMPSSSVSPKHGTSSPKHISSGSAGKPSMSALKSAANSPSGKGDGSSISSKTKLSTLSSSTSTLPLSTSSSSSSSASSMNKEFRDKERKSSSLMFTSGSSSGHQSPKSKSSVSKVKSIESDLQGSTSSSSGTGSTTPPADPNKSVTCQQQARNRKGSLSAVIDKLKNAQHCTDEGATPAANISPNTPTPQTNIPGKNLSGEVKNPLEYKVKPSSDVMKLTINTVNKSRTKDLKSNNNNLKISSVNLPGSSVNVSMGGVSPSSSSSGNGSPKTTYTGLKPGVISGPASRKPQTQTSPKIRSSSPLISSGSGSGIGKGFIPGQKTSGSSKSSSSSNLISGGISLGKSKSFPSSSSRDKSRFKTGDKSFAGKVSDYRKSVELESEKTYKLLTAHASSMGGMSALQGITPQLVVEGLIKQLDKNFQIPKLSARVNADNSEKRSVDKVDGISSKTISESPSRLSDPTVSSTSTVPKLDEASNLIGYVSGSSTASAASNLMEPEGPTNLSMQPGDNVNQGTESSSSLKSLNLVTKTTEKYKDDKDQQQSFHRASHSDKKLMESNVTPASITLTPLPSAPSGSTSSQEAAEMLLDFSSPKEGGSSSGNIALKSSISFTPSSSPHQKNTTPPPPLPPPLPPPPPPTSTTIPAAVLASVPPSVSPISSFPQSPSVSLHIVKSPAPSPRVIPLSPHSASPCITDDELMDEALVGS